MDRFTALICSADGGKWSHLFNTQVMMWHSEDLIEEKTQMFKSSPEFMIVSISEVYILV